MLHYVKIQLIFFIIVLGVVSSCSKEKRPSDTSHHTTPEHVDIERIIIFVFENEDESRVYNDAYFRSLAFQGSYFKKYYGLTHPSQPNYLGMIGGSVFGHYSNSNVDIDGENLVDLLEDANKTWKVFADDYPGNCFLGSRNLYVRKHNPFMSFTNITSNPERCNKIESSEDFISDWENGSLPDFSFYVPNNRNNGHNTSVGYASKWFKKNSNSLLTNPELMKDTLVIITFDEDSKNNKKNRNKIYTLFLGPMVKVGYVSKQKFDHYSLLRTIEEIWDLGDLGRKDEDAEVITNVWKY